MARRTNLDDLQTYIEEQTYNAEGRLGQLVAELQLRERNSETASQWADRVLCRTDALDDARADVEAWKLIGAQLETARGIGDPSVEMFGHHMLRRLADLALNEDTSRRLLHMLANNLALLG